VAKSSLQALLQRADVEMLQSPGTTTGRMSEGTTRATIGGMLISMGVLAGWLVTEKTKAEGPVEPVDQPRRLQLLLQKTKRESLVCLSGDPIGTERRFCN
jgi:hypothetical protein